MQKKPGKLHTSHHEVIEVLTCYSGTAGLLCVSVGTSAADGDSI